MPEEPPIVLLHGVGLDQSMWGPFRVEAEALTGKTMIALDLPGHGTATEQLRGPISLSDFTERILASLPSRSHLVGFSLGALVAQNIARYHPDRVATLTNVSSVCERSPAERRTVMNRLDSAAADFDASIDASIERWFPAEVEVPPGTREASRTVLRRNAPSSYLHAYRLFATADEELGPELSRISVPALATTGELDPGSTPEMTRRLGSLIPGCETQILPGARHMVPVERPHELASTIIGFIERAERNNG